MSTRGGNWTWGLYRLRLADRGMSVIDPPGYVEKNYPREGPGGETIWALRDSAGVEWLGEQDAFTGAFHRLAAAGGGARWPSFAASGRWLLYTVLTRQVEYWLATRVESPADSGPALPAASHRFPQSLKAFSASRSTSERSPIDKFRR